VEVRIPPLRERPEDIPLLADHFLKKFRKKTRKSIGRISPEAIAALRKYSFPGNVRELENAIEHAFVMCHSDAIEPVHLPGSITRAGAAVNGVSAGGRHEKEVIAEALQRNDGNRSRTARELGMHRSTLWRKVRMYGLGE
jgi:DNA-binding NtrC family response regulator